MEPIGARILPCGYYSRRRRNPVDMSRTTSKIFMNSQVSLNPSYPPGEGEDRHLPNQGECRLLGQQGENALFSARDTSRKLNALPAPKTAAALRWWTQLPWCQGFFAKLSASSAAPRTHIANPHSPAACK